MFAVRVALLQQHAGIGVLLVGLGRREVRLRDGGRVRRVRARVLRLLRDVLVRVGTRLAGLAGGKLVQSELAKD